MLKNRRNIRCLIILTLSSTIMSTNIFINTAMAETVTKVNNVSQSVEVKQDINKNIDAIRLKWKDDLTGGENIDLSSPIIKSKVDGVSKEAKGYIDSLNRDNNRTTLWNDTDKYKVNPAQITTSYKRLAVMAKAYAIKGSSFYKDENLKNDIINAMDWLYTNAYNENVEAYGNWWDWQIGIPPQLNNIVILMYDSLTEGQIKDYMKGIQKFLPEVMPGSKFHTGANLADVSINKLLQGVNLKDESKIKEASERVVSIFDYVNEGDGFYKDGSFIQHTDMAYTGSYGNVLLGRAANMLFLLESTPWSIQSKSKNNVYTWIFENFSPVIYKGYVMEMVRGRAVSRSYISGYNEASGIIESLVKLSIAANPEDSAKIKSMVKQWSLESGFDFSKAFGSINMVKELNNITNNQDIVPLKEKADHFPMNKMDKTVHKRENYTLAISRSSIRISKYEYMNDENLRPWFQGDGVTYLFNGDLNQYTDDFWPTVNPYRLPGTTIDTRIREDKSGITDKNYYEKGLSNWSGGTRLGAYGISGMQIDNKNDSLKANKSWFMFDDEVVSLGSGISSNDEYVVESIIDNKKINKRGSNKLIIDGIKKDTTLGWSEDIKGARWAHLEGNTTNSDIGYYFPKGSDIKALREHRTGAWTDISKTTKLSKPIDPTQKENNFLSLYIDHGKAPKDAIYSYVLLPNKSSEEVASYANNPQVQIIEDSSSVHAVKHMGLKITAANFWNDEKTSVDIITSDKKSSVIVKENSDDTLTISVSDPTFIADDINIEVAKSALELVSKDEEVTLADIGDSIKLSVNTKNSNGGSFLATFKLKDKTTNLEEVKSQDTEDTNDVKPAKDVSPTIDVDIVKVDNSNIDKTVHNENVYEKGENKNNISKLGKYGIPLYANPMIYGIASLIGGLFLFTRKKG